MNKYETVDEFLADLPADRLKQVELLRKLIKNAEPKLHEHIKWNSPSYIFNGEDRVTFNMHYPDRTMLLLHMGATRKENKKGEPIMKDPSGLIEWNSDIRGTLSFKSLDEIKQRQDVISQLLSDWIAVS